MQSLIKISDISASEIENLIGLAFEYKKKFALGIRKENLLNGKMVAMIFEKPSLRTKVAFEIATEYLGGTAVYLSNAQILASGQNQRGRESIPDIARNLERFSDLILARVYDHQTITTMSGHIKKPIINALCDLHHPTQSLADLMAIRGHKGGDQISLTYIGDGNNVATSLAQICLISGINFTFCGPKTHQINPDFISAVEAKASFSIVEDPYEAVSNADCVYTDTFVSMGEENEKIEKLAAFAKYQVDKSLFEAAKSDAVFMHCLPAHRGEEVTDEVMDHERSIVFDQAECRMHVAKALLTQMLRAT
ncbi:ornithine carbamoyltransferase [Oligoflexaceae bacterium]|nr:ornithine carbamoyltransferase [Oligoflexaceae bacterium]